MPRDMMENERSTAINPSESVEEKFLCLIDLDYGLDFIIWIKIHF